MRRPRWSACGSEAARRHGRDALGGGRRQLRRRSPGPPGARGRGRRARARQRAARPSCSPSTRTRPGCCGRISRHRPSRRSRRRRSWSAGSGVDRLVALAFDAVLAALSPEAFVSEVLAALLGARHVVVGESFRFGAARQGNAADARGAGRPAGLRRGGGAAACSHGGRPISSSRVREALGVGDVSDAARAPGAALLARRTRRARRRAGPRPRHPDGEPRGGGADAPGARGLRWARAAAGRRLARGGRQRRRAADVRRDGRRGRGAPARFQRRPLRRAPAAVASRRACAANSASRAPRRSSSRSAADVRRRARGFRRRRPGYSRKGRPRDERALVSSRELEGVVLLYPSGFINAHTVSRSRASCRRR